MPHVDEITNVQAAPCAAKVKPLRLLLATTQCISMTFHFTDQTLHDTLQYRRLVHVTSLLPYALLPPSLLRLEVMVGPIDFLGFHVCSI